MMANMCNMLARMVQHVGQYVQNVGQDGRFRPSPGGALNREAVLLRVLGDPEEEEEEDEEEKRRGSPFYIYKLPIDRPRGCYVNKYINIYIYTYIN